MRALDFTEETLSKRICWIKLKNIQGIKDIQFNIPPSGIVRINASSETGKSSAFRPLEALVTSKYNTKREIESLVTKGKAYGEIVVKQLNGKYIGMHLNAKKITNSFYVIQEPDGTQYRLHYPADVYKIAKELGWYTTGTGKNPDFCLNIRLKGELPIIDTSKRLNTELFNVALNDEQLENTITTVKMAAETALGLYNIHNTNYKQVQFAMQNLKIEDEDKLKTEINYLTKLKSVMTSTDQMLKDLGTVFNFLRFKPQKPIFHPYALKDMEHLQQTNTILDTLNPLITTLHQRTKLKPQLPDINPELSKLETLAQPLNSLKDLITTHRKKPKHPQTTLQDLDADLDYQHQTAQALNNLTALKQYTSNKPSLPVSTQDFTPLVKTCEQLNQTLNTLDTLKTTLNQIPNQTKLPNNLNPLLNALQSLQTLQDALTHRPRVPILKDFTDMDLQMEQHLQDLKQQLHSTLNNLTRKPSKPTNVTDLTIPLRTLTTLQATLPLVNKLVEHVPKTNMKRHELEELTQALAKYQCPTCGSFYLGGNKV